MYIHIHIHMYTYIHAYMHTYTYTYTYNVRKCKGKPLRASQSLSETLPGTGYGQF